MSVRIERKVCPDGSTAAITVAASVVLGEGCVMLTTDTQKSADFFGPLAITLNCKLARELANAIIDAIYEAEQGVQTSI